MLRNIWNYIKDFIDRCIYFYKNDVVYRKSTKKILLFFIIINFICLLIDYFDSSWLKDWFWINVSWYVVVSVVICFVRLLVQILYSFITIPSDYIQPDMDKLPEKIGEYPVVIQYNPPKWLNPSELWMIYNQSYESTNLDCLLYKWEYEWLVEIEDKWNWTIILYRNKEIDNKVPSYERQYWTLVFGFDRKDRVIWKWNLSKLDLKEVTDLHSELLSYCIEKWWLRSENIWCSRLIPMIICIFLIPISPFIWIVVILYFFIILIYHSNKVWFGSLNLFKKILPTDEWNKLLAHIVWFKYWLEKCEEKQIKKILNDEPWFKNRILPYIVALRMDWKFLDRKYNK